MSQNNEIGFWQRNGDDCCGEGESTRGRVCAAPKSSQRLCTIHLHSGFISQELASILLDSNQVCAATQIIKDLAPYFIHFKDIRINIEFIFKDEN